MFELLTVIIKMHNILKSIAVLIAQERRLWPGHVPEGMATKSCVVVLCDLETLTNQIALFLTALF